MRRHEDEQLTGHEAGDRHDERQAGGDHRAEGDEQDEERGEEADRLAVVRRAPGPFERAALGSDDEGVRAGVADDAGDVRRLRRREGGSGDGEGGVGDALVAGDPGGGRRGGPSSLLQGGEIGLVGGPVLPRLGHLAGDRLGGSRQGCGIGLRERLKGGRRQLRGLVQATEGRGYLVGVLLGEPGDRLPVAVRDRREAVEDRPGRLRQLRHGGQRARHRAQLIGADRLEGCQALEQRPDRGDVRGGDPGGLRDGLVGLRGDGLLEALLLGPRA